MTSMILFLALQFVTTQPYVFDDNRIIRQASELVPWCKAKAEQHYMLQNIQTYQWTASHHSYSTSLYVDGKLRAGDNDVSVRCQITSGAREQTAAIEISAR